MEAAHEKGIIHRDLKPGNVKITADDKVKVLDFGLAKAFYEGTAALDPSKSPTITEQMTEPGVILGTAAYMSPEQAKGRPVDKRTDIWAFGCILYECLTGKRAFTGETVSDTVAAILRAEPNWDSLPADTPGNVRAVLHRCLQKDPRERLRDIADARFEIEAQEAYRSEAFVSSPRPSPLWFGVGGVVMLLAGIVIGRVLIRNSRSTPAAPVVMSTIKVEPGHWLDGQVAEMQRPSRTAMAISSDGRFVVYSAVEENPGPQAKPQLYLRKFDQLDAKPITGTEGGINPFLSPDNRWVGFWVDGKLKKVPVEGGISNTLGDLSPWFFGASWGPDNRIIFTDGYDVGLSVVSADGVLNFTLI